jgi:hypothetical protein
LTYGACTAHITPSVPMPTSEPEGHRTNDGRTVATPPSVGDQGPMVTSFVRHIRSEKKSEQSVSCIPVCGGRTCRVPGRSGDAQPSRPGPPGSRRGIHPGPSRHFLRASSSRHPTSLVLRAWLPWIGPPVGRPEGRWEVRGSDDRNSRETRSVAGRSPHNPASVLGVNVLPDIRAVNTHLWVKVPAAGPRFHSEAHGEPTPNDHRPRDEYGRSIRNHPAR